MTCTVAARALTWAVAGMIASAPAARAVDTVDASGAEVGGRYAYDLLVLRTTGLVQTAVGAAFLIPAYPISIGSGASDEIVSRLVVDPARDTFQRPIGED